MAEATALKDALVAMGVDKDHTNEAVITESGTVLQTITKSTFGKDDILLPITPEDFINAFSSTEFDFNKLMKEFANFVEDFDKPLVEGKSSKALGFSSKMLFEYGPYIRSKRKARGNQAARLRFQHGKLNGETWETHFKTIIITDFKEIVYTKPVEGGILILTFRQAALLAMVTFNRAIEYCYNFHHVKLMTPLCGAIFSRDSITEMSKDLDVDEVKCLKMINSSSCSGGQHLDDSDMSCAVVCVITSTKCISDKHVRDMMIAKVVKQYTHKQKVFNEQWFTVFSKYALGGVPCGLDSSTLIEKYNNIQSTNISARIQARAIREASLHGPETKVQVALYKPDPPIAPARQPVEQHIPEQLMETGQQTEASKSFLQKAKELVPGTKHGAKSKGSADVKFSELPDDIISTKDGSHGSGSTSDSTESVVGKKSEEYYK